jgi:hypothetical protein
VAAHVAAGTHFPTGYWPYSVATADLNGDAKLDLVTANDGARTNPGVSVLLGAGNGSFGPKSDFGSGGGRDVKIADLNGDSIVDLAVANVNDLRRDVFRTWRWDVLSFAQLPDRMESAVHRHRRPERRLETRLRDGQRPREQRDRSDCRRRDGSIPT